MYIVNDPSKLGVVKHSLTFYEAEQLFCRLVKERSMVDLIDQETNEVIANSKAGVVRYTTRDIMTHKEETNELEQQVSDLRKKGIGR